MPSIFSRIIAGELPCYKIKETDLFIAFLDITPIVEGHVLVVPKVEVDKLYELDNEYLAEMLLFAKPIAKAIEICMPCKRCGFSVIGLEVPHAHLHVVPINNADDLNFTRDKLSISSQRLEEIQNLILQVL